MTFEEFFNLCGSSSEDDWNLVPSGPSYLNRFLPLETRVRDDDSALTFELRHEEHWMRASYKPNLAVGIAWGMYVHPPLPGERPEIFYEDWATQFPDDRPTMHSVDFFYFGAMIARHYYVHVDSRCKLPLPQRVFAPDDEGGKVTALTITPWQLDFFRVLNGLETTVNYDGYVARAGFTVVSD